MTLQFEGHPLKPGAVDGWASELSDDPVIAEWLAEQGVSKSDPRPRATQVWQTIHAAADRMMPTLRRAFLQAIAAAASGAGTLAEIASAIESGSVVDVLRALKLDSVQKDLEDRLRSGEFTDALVTTYASAGAEVMPAVLAQLRRQTNVPFELRFDMQNPRAVDFLRAYDGNLIKEMSSEMRRSMISVVQNAYERGGHPYAQAREIRAMENFGLTSQQNLAVNNYRSSLVEAGMPSTQVTKLADKYRWKMLRYRSENIARTETIRAAEAGHHEAWRQAADAGLYDPLAARRFWVITPDDRLCDICKAIPKLNEKGVGLDAQFQTQSGTITRPPLHPHCRCSVVMRFPEDDEEVGKSWHTQPRVPSGPKGGEWTSGGGFVPLSGVHDLTPEQRWEDANKSIGAAKMQELADATMKKLGIDDWSIKVTVWNEPGFDALANAGNHGVTINRAYWTKTGFDKHMPEWSGLVVDPSPKGTMIHEIGHVVYKRTEAKIGMREAHDIVMKHTEGLNKPASPYGGENWSEAAAEAFVSYNGGKPLHDHDLGLELHSRAVAMWTELLDKSK